MKKEITLFAKKCNTKEGKEFKKIFTKIGELLCRVSFLSDTRPPLKFPCNIVIDKEHTSYAIKTRVNNETSEKFDTPTLYISRWEIGSEYVDNSAAFLFE